jgi:predicted RecB family nuclease
MTLRLSASRLNSFLGCQHHAALWLAGEKPPEEDNASLELVRRKGFEHEALVLGSLERELGPAVSIPETALLPDRIAATRAAMERGAPLIYQGAFANDRWVGFPDFLVRRQADGSSRWVYEPEDAKLARKAKAEHLIQLNIYAHLIEESSGADARFGAIHVGGGAPAERFDLGQTRHITARLKGKFEAFQDLLERQTKPVRSAACAQCPYQTRCDAEWRAADSPVFVAGITSDQIVRLGGASITTMSQIAALEPTQPVARIGAKSFDRLVRQAHLQKVAVGKGQHLVQLLPVEPVRGFSLLPTPEQGDLFFDMEGDPLYPEGLEYLFGVYGPLGEKGEEAFVPFWAHDHAAEKRAFETLMDMFGRHLERYPKARIYHYAAYEPVALKKLAMRYATREAELDALLRHHTFVDLYTVARQAIRASTEGYSLKDLEKIYWGGRSGEVTNAGDSIVEYERWRETGEQSILNAICLYNEDDCVSTSRLRTWLETLRPAGAVYDLTDPRADDPEGEARAAAREAFEQKRRDVAALVRAGAFGDEDSRDLVAELLWFHQRAQKPVWWQIFDRQTWTDEELTEDIESLGGLTLRGQVQDKRSFVATYAFEPQETRLKEGSTPKISATLENAGSITELSAEDGRVVLRRGTAKGDFPTSCSLSPGSPIKQDKLIEGVVSLAGRVAHDPTSDQAFVDLLMGRTPRLRGRQDGLPVIAMGEDALAGAIAAVRDLDTSCLVIQGPPGTGKTWTTARAVVALLQDGKRVAVSSNSHKAINNLLEAVEAHAREIGFSFSGAKKDGRDEGNAYLGELVVSVESSGDVQMSHRLVGGTAFHFATELPLSYDYLFVDEAGQVALGNLAAMAGCARNLVLVGDQMQLPQPVQGVHPGKSGLSCLDYAMENLPTVPVERGILLNVSRRMHPSICNFISVAMYDGRLTAHP